MTPSLDRLRRLGCARPKELTHLERQIAAAEELLGELQREQAAATQKAADIEGRVGGGQRGAGVREGLAALAEARWGLEALEGALQAKRDALAALRAAAEEVAEGVLARERAAVLDALSAEMAASRKLTWSFVTGEIIPRAEAALAFARRHRELGGESLPWENQPARALAREVLGALVQALSPGAELFGWDAGAAQEAARLFRGLP